MPSRGSLGRAAAIALLAGAPIAGAGCGGSGATGTTPPPGAAGRAGVHPAWGLERAAWGATLPLPPGWQAIAGDPGSLSAALRDRSGRFLGYLNVTPRQASERAANWRSFRPAHNRAEGDRDVRVIPFSHAVKLGAGPAACVQDAYTTTTAVRYVELACIVEGPHAAVLVGAAPPQRWAVESGEIRRALAEVRL